MNKLHHKITALILSICMILSITPLSFAQTMTMEEMTQIQTPVKTGAENLISTKDNSIKIVGFCWGEMNMKK